MNGWMNERKKEINPNKINLIFYDSLIIIFTVCKLLRVTFQNIEFFWSNLNEYKKKKIEEKQKWKKKIENANIDVIKAFSKSKQEIFVKKKDRKTK